VHGKQVGESISLATARDLVRELQVALDAVERTMCTANVAAVERADMLEWLGTYLTVDEAKGHAEAYAGSTYPVGTLRWHQVSDTTWGLMSGQTDTRITVQLIEAEETP
jgi:hypothetical protein